CGCGSTATGAGPRQPACGRARGPVQPTGYALGARGATPRLRAVAPALPIADAPMEAGVLKGKRMRRPRSYAPGQMGDAGGRMPAGGRRWDAWARAGRRQGRGDRDRTCAGVPGGARLAEYRGRSAPAGPAPGQGRAPRLLDLRLNQLHAPPPAVAGAGTSVR